MPLANTRAGTATPRVINDAQLYRGDCLDILAQLPANTGRRFIGIELDETYFNIAAGRIYVSKSV